VIPFSATGVVTRSDFLPCRDVLVSKK